MATFRIYKCKGCGYSVETEPQGHYGLMIGEFYNFRCAKCKMIVSIHVEDLARQGYLPTCPECGASNEDIYTWNPVDGKCPKCGRKMVIDESAGIIMAD